MLLCGAGCVGKSGPSVAPVSLPVVVPKGLVPDTGLWEELGQAQAYSVAALVTPGADWSLDGGEVDCTRAALGSTLSIDNRCLVSC